MLWIKERPGEDLVVRGARVVDPAQGIDAVLDVRIDGGTIAAVGENIDANGHRVVDAAGLVLAPAFVDPHVHLRTPGREDEETLATGTAAAAAGGYCAILAMPNTDPVVDSAATLGSLADTARREADVHVGFFAAITRGQDGGELTEMGELADAGAVAFSDDGVPVVSAGMMRRALQYASIDRAAARAALRGADAVARRPRARGRRRGRARLRRLSVGRRIGDGRARSLARGVRGAADSSHAPLRGRVRRRAPARARGGRPRERRGHAAPSLPHRRGRAVARPEREDEPAASRGAGPRGAARGAARRDDRGDRDRPRAARATRERGAVRGGAVRRHRARDGVRGALHAARRDRRAGRSAR